VTTHDDDILDFDFFDEDATREAPAREAREAERPAEKRPRPPRLRPPGGLTPLLRLVGVIAFAILIIVLLVVWAQGCASDDKRGAYETYLGDVRVIGANSARIGSDLAELLTTTGLTQAQLETRLTGLVQQQRIGVQRAQGLDPPGPVTPAHLNTVQALQFRVAGIQGLLATFRATKDVKDASAAGQQLSAQSRRLITSDVVWDDLFRLPTQRLVREEGFEDLAVPDSNFVANPELYSTRSLTLVWQRVHGASTGGTPSGLHGNGLSYTKVLPSGQTLSTSVETTIKASTDLAFEVGVQNTGENQEVRVAVTLTIPTPSGGSPITKTQRIDLIDPGETKTVTFRNFPDPPFGEKTTVKVDVKPVPGETNTTNNTAEYPVIFSL
jgi:hypothetical protein